VEGIQRLVGSANGVVVVAEVRQSIEDFLVHLARRLLLDIQSLHQKHGRERGFDAAK
jgi:hypothetical protein